MVKRGSKDAIPVGSVSWEGEEKTTQKWNSLTQALMFPPSAGRHTAFLQCHFSDETRVKAENQLFLDSQNHFIWKDPWEHRDWIERFEICLLSYSLFLCRNCFVRFGGGGFFFVGFFFFVGSFSRSGFRAQMSWSICLLTPTETISPSSLRLILVIIWSLCELVQL